MRHNIIFEFKHEGSKSKTKGLITAKLNDEDTYVDKADVGSESGRNKYITNLLVKYPALKNSKDDMLSKLTEIASKLLTEEELPQDEQEILEACKPLNRSKKALEQTDEGLIQLAKEFLMRPDLIEEIIEHTQLVGLAEEKDLAVTLYIIFTSRLLKSPLAGIVMGQSSSGKSYVIKTISDMFPDEVKLNAHRITPRALEYMPPGSLEHLMVVAGERSRKQDDDAAESTRSLREMISEHKLTLLVTSKDENGRICTEHRILEGPIAYVESTTLGVQDIFDEDRTRFVLICSDESPQQTKAVMDKAIKNASNAGNNSVSDNIIALHHTAQRLLKPCGVIIPFADKFVDILPADKVEARRTIGHLISFIKAVAILHQFQREKDKYDNIIATLDDYNIVRKYLSAPLARSLGKELTPGAKEMLNVIYEQCDIVFTVAQVSALVGVHDNTVRARFKELLKAGQIEIDVHGSGRRGNDYKVAAVPKPVEGFELPEIEFENDPILLSKAS